MKTKIIPFDIQLAKKIQAGEIKGKIKTRNLKYECILVEPCVYTGHTCDEHLLLIKFPAHDFEKESLKVYHSNGRYMSDKHGDNWFDLVLEVPNDEIQLKPFDKVLVRDKYCDIWRCSLFSHKTKNGYYAAGFCWKQCIPYEGNEHLLGTIDEPKEE